MSPPRTGTASRERASAAARRHQFYSAVKNVNADGAEEVMPARLVAADGQPETVCGPSVARSSSAPASMVGVSGGSTPRTRRTQLSSARRPRPGACCNLVEPSPSPSPYPVKGVRRMRASVGFQRNAICPSIHGAVLARTRPGDRTSFAGPWRETEDQSKPRMRQN
jgi:hypothetical protein